jgi:hypothetical protein
MANASTTNIWNPIISLCLSSGIDAAAHTCQQVMFQSGILQQTNVANVWLVVSAPLKNISQLNYYSQYMEK